MNLNHILSKNWLASSTNLLKKGINLGHKSLSLSKKKFWHPLMANYVLGIRHKMAIINIQQTQKSVLRAFLIIAFILKNNGHLLIVNTNPQYFNLHKNICLITTEQKLNKTGKLSKTVKKYNNLKINNISYSYYKWVGGTLTNWKQISKSVLTYAKFSERCEQFLINNNIEFPRYKKIKTCFDGLIKKENGKSFLFFNEKPDLIFLINPNENYNIISEANRLHIPIIALTESNTNIKGITYPIPINSYSISFIYYCLKKIIKLSNILSSK